MSTRTPASRQPASHARREPAAPSDASYIERHILRLEELSRRPATRHLRQLVALCRQVIAGADMFCEQHHTKCMCDVCQAYAAKMGITANDAVTEAKKAIYEVSHDIEAGTPIHEEIVRAIFLPAQEI